MKYCNNCFRFAVGTPPYCTFCGRSYDVRLCKRGHINSRASQFCSQCGSEDLSLPAPAETLLSRMSRWSVQLALGMFVGVVALALGVSIFVAIDWSAVGPRLVLLGLVVWFLYWATTLLPGPIRKAGGSLGKRIVGKSDSNKESRRKHG